MTINEFRDVVWQYYAREGRDLPWREGINAPDFPYRVLVSELMLQQTQVTRVIPKFEQFIWQFPNISDLAHASLADVLTAWQGLGYNRRAKFLHAAARAFQNSGVPSERTALLKQTGIGPNTAGAIVVYAHNRPEVFVETNIRSVFLHHFYSDELAVPDSDLLPYIAQALDQKNPREWYWALMDYGTYIKKQHGNTARRSTHYAKQSTFAGSRRHVRGQILRTLAKYRTVVVADLRRTIDDDRLDDILAALIREGLIELSDGRYRLPEHETDRDTI